MPTRYFVWKEKEIGELGMVDGLTILVSLTAAVVVFAMVAKLATKVLKIALLVTFVLFVASQVWSKRAELCTPLKSLDERISTYVCP